METKKLVMDKEKLEEWVATREEIYKTLIEEAEKNNDSGTYFRGCLSSLIDLKEAITSNKF